MPAPVMNITEHLLLMYSESCFRLSVACSLISKMICSSVFSSIISSFSSFSFVIPLFSSFFPLFSFVISLFSSFDMSTFVVVVVVVVNGDGDDCICVVCCCCCEFNGDG